MDPIERLREIETHPDTSDALRSRARALREQAEHERRLLAKMDRSRGQPPRNEGRVLTLGYGITREEAARRVDELAAQGVKRPGTSTNELDRIVARYELSRGR